MAIFVSNIVKIESNRECLLSKDCRDASYYSTNIVKVECRAKFT